MGNFRRSHANKTKEKSKNKSPEKMRAEEEMVGDPGGVAIVVDATDEEELEEVGKKMVVLQWLDGVDLVVPEAEASRCGVQLEHMIIRYDTYAPAGGSSGYPRVHLRVDSAALSLILHCSRHTHANTGWAAAGPASTTPRFLTSKDLGNRSLLDLACNTVAAMVDGKSSDEICAMFGIRPACGSAPRPDPKVEKALLALHFVRYHGDGVSAYDPKLRRFVATWYCRNSHRHRRINSVSPPPAFYFNHTN